MLHIKLKKMAHASNMVANVNPWIPPDPGGGVNRSKVYFFSMVMLHIKLKGMTNAVICKQIFCPYILKFCLFHVLVFANNK